MSEIRPITDEELTSPERVQAWMRETAQVLEIKEMVHYQPDEVFEPIEGAGDTLRARPVYLFRLGTRYGTSLAKLLPHIVAAPEWSVQARADFRSRKIIINSGA